MILHTIQMSQWRKAKQLDITFLDITVKSGDKVFAPTWELLMRYKGDYDEVYYTKEYTRLMRESFKDHRQHWLELCNQDEVAIACYCKAGNFCHRYILVDFLRKVCESEGIDFKYEGEII